MKKLLLVLLVLSTSISFAEEQTLLKVSNLENAKLDLTNDAKELGYTTNEQLEKVSNITLDKSWDVEFSSSANTFENKVQSKASFIKGVSKTYGDMIVVNAVLPKHNSTVTVKPIYPMSMNNSNEGLGYITNAADIKTIRAKFSGINRDDKVSIIITDNKGTHKFPMTKPTQRIDGAVECVWENVNYIDDPRKKEINIKPTYPQTNSEIRFDGFEIHSQIGGVIAFAFGDIDIIYDKAFLNEEPDIDFEKLFGANAVKTKKERLDTAKKILEKETFVLVNEKLMAKEPSEKPVE